MSPNARPLCAIALAAMLAPGTLAQAAESAQGDAHALRVTVQTVGSNALDSGALPSGAAASAPTDYAVLTEALDSNLTLGTLATVASGPLRAGVRALLGKEHAEASAAASSIAVRIGGALGVSVVADGAASNVVVGCTDGAPSVGLDMALEGALVTMLGVPVSIAADAAPNTVVPLLVPGARLVLNEQSIVGGVATVTALHLTLDDALLTGSSLPTLVDADVSIARASATLSACGSFVDGDGDGLLDSADGCPADPDPGQRDSDGDGAGDACDVDDDGDLVIDALDSCPLEPDRSQGACGGIFAHGFE